MKAKSFSHIFTSTKNPTKKIEIKFYTAEDIDEVATLTTKTFVEREPLSVFMGWTLMIYFLYSNLLQSRL